MSCLHLQADLRPEYSKVHQDEWLNFIFFFIYLNGIRTVMQKPHFHVSKICSNDILNCGNGEVECIGKPNLVHQIFFFTNIWIEVCQGIVQSIKHLFKFCNLSQYYYGKAWFTEIFLIEQKITGR